MTLDRKNHSM